MYYLAEIDSGQEVMLPLLTVSPKKQTVREVIESLLKKLEVALTNHCDAKNYVLYRNYTNYTKALFYIYYDVGYGELYLGLLGLDGVGTKPKGTEEVLKFVRSLEDTLKTPNVSICKE